MADWGSYICATCGERHQGVPGLSFDAPYQYHQMPSEERTATAFLNADICVIDDEDFFVRACLEIRVHGQDEPFVWGVWVSLSQPNFERYVETIGKSSDEEGPYFGWLCSRLPGYPDTLLLKTYVQFRSGNLRPSIELEPTDHPLSRDQRNGISPDALRPIIEANLHPERPG